jgi:para-aminobenzoate synthetase / 4-amino-4-deoxychorismate lyase
MLHIHSSAELLHILQTNDHLVLLENTQGKVGMGWNDLFVDPIHILQIHHVSEFLPLLEIMQKYVEEGYYLAGYFAYECGYFLEKLGLLDYTAEGRPLAWFGVYRYRYRIDASLLRNHRDDWLTTEEIDTNVQDLRFDLDEETYRKKVERVQEHIRAGDVYQINLTGRYHFHFEGTPLTLYARLRQVQPTPYSAYIRTGAQTILSFSPELFFHLDGQRITTQPMKGTAPRGRTLSEDERQAAWLQSDSKNRAENIMIVDLLRNDLGRICSIGSVVVPHLFKVETYDTVLQMTSTITGTLANRPNYVQTFASLFPCGSVTGAPKIKAMEIINQLEDTPRGIYTGSVGYIAPQTIHTPSHALFNVAIRTIVLEQGHGIMGIGSGIVHDSSATAEAAECKVKAHFLTTQPRTFDILETILWDGHYHHLEKHLQRMAASARYFGYPWDEEYIRTCLAGSVQDPHPTPPHPRPLRDPAGPCVGVGGADEGGRGSLTDPDNRIITENLASYLSGIAHHDSVPASDHDRVPASDHDTVRVPDARKGREGTSPTSTHLRFTPTGPVPTSQDNGYKIRLRLNRQGELHCESHPIQKTTQAEPLLVALSAERIDSRDRMYFHKTTYRPLYERAQRFAQQYGYADIIFLNEKGEVTEGAISNVFIERAGQLLTPPVECGLLAGVYRQCILEECSNVQEAVLSLDDLLSAEKVYICNAIRGLHEVRVVRVDLFR